MNRYYKHVICAVFFSALSFQIGASEPMDWRESNWSAVQIDIGKIVSLEKQFHHSLCLFLNPVCLRDPSQYLVIAGNAIEPIAGRKVIHIKGHAVSSIDLEEQSELVIGGDVQESAVINVDGITRIFVAGDFNGKIIATGSVQLTIQGSFNGEILTGQPSTDISVGKSFNGVIRSNSYEGGLLVLAVHGHTNKHKIVELLAQPYNAISAYYAQSDHPMGVFSSPSYPKHIFTIRQNITY